MEIKTNNVPRPILYAHELTKRDIYALGMDKNELVEADNDGESFFRYKGWCYRLGDFMRIMHDEFKGWHGYHSDSFFSGVLIKITDCGDSVIVGTYFS